jgi:hypothetical protein
VYGDGKELFSNDSLAGLTTGFNKKHKGPAKPTQAKPIQKRLL